MYVVLSPAKTLDFKPVNHSVKTTDPIFKLETQTLAEILKGFSTNDIKTLMHVSDQIATLNFDRYQDFFNQDEKMALLAFQGGVYKGMDAQSMDDTTMQYAGDHVGILSGIYGLLKASDLMQPYRLEMGTKLKNDHGKDLYAFWGDKIAKAINDNSDAVGASHLINLASNEYASAINTSILNKPVVDIVFKEIKGNKPPKIIGVHAKKARGFMTRYIVENQVTSLDGLRQFQTEGYEFEPSVSDDQTITFYRRHAV